MGQVLHGSVRTTEAVRREIQRGQESLRALAKRHRINQDSCEVEEAHWGQGSADGSKGRAIDSAEIEEEAVIVAFAGTRCYLWTIASMRCKPRSRT
jgi:hypothetical protein